MPFSFPSLSSRVHGPWRRTVLFYYTRIGHMRGWVWLRIEGHFHLLRVVVRVGRIGVSTVVCHLLMVHHWGVGDGCRSMVRLLLKRSGRWRYYYLGVVVWGPVEGVVRRWRLYRVWLVSFVCRVILWVYVLKHVQFPYAKSGATKNVQKNTKSSYLKVLKT